MTGDEYEELDWYSRLKKWFMNNNEESDMVIDAEWKILDVNDNAQKMMVVQPNIPFPIGVHVTDPVIHISIFTTVETYDWEKPKKADNFRALLVQNDESHFIKFVLMGRNDEIVLRVDLDTQYLNKKEFNTALSSLIHGGNWCLTKLEGLYYGMDEMEGEGVMNEEKALEPLKLGIQIDLNRGRKTKDIIRDLVTAGMEQDLAAQIVMEVVENPITVNKCNDQGEYPISKEEEESKTDAYIH